MKQNEIHYSSKSNFKHYFYIAFLQILIRINILNNI